MDVIASIAFGMDINAQSSTNHPFIRHAKTFFGIPNKRSKAMLNFIIMTVGKCYYYIPIYGSILILKELPTENLKKVRFTNNSIAGKFTSKTTNWTVLELSYFSYNILGG